MKFEVKRSFDRACTSEKRKVLGGLLELIPCHSDRRLVLGIFRTLKAVLRTC